MKRPPLDEARAAVIAKRMAADEVLEDHMNVFWCVDCQELWFEDATSDIAAEYATWLCYIHYHGRRAEWKLGYDPIIRPFLLWRKA